MMIMIYSRIDLSTVNPINIFLNSTRYMTSSEYIVVSRSIIIDNPAENVWITLKAFGGNWHLEAYVQLREGHQF